MSDDHIEDEILQSAKEFAEEKKEDLASSWQDKTEDVKENLESASEVISDKVSEISEIAEEKFEAVEETAEDVKESVHSEITDVKDAAEKKQEEILDAAEDMKASIQSKIFEAKEAAEERHGELLETAEEMKNSVHAFAEETAEKIAGEGDVAAESLKDKTEKFADELRRSDEIQSVHSSFEGAEDELEQIPVKGHASKIPQYVPKQYTRDIPEEREPAGVRGSLSDSDYDGYPTIDDVQPAPRGVKNASGDKSSNTTLWIVLGILVVLCLIGCCLISAFFGLIRVLGG